MARQTHLEAEPGGQLVRRDRLHATGSRRLQLIRRARRSLGRLDGVRQRLGLRERGERLEERERAHRGPGRREIELMRDERRIGRERAAVRRIVHRCCVVND